jgi:hypothetical protein
VVVVDFVVVAVDVDADVSSEEHVKEIAMIQITM